MDKENNISKSSIIDGLFEKHFLSIIDEYKIYHNKRFPECRYYHLYNTYFLFHDVNKNQIIINEELFYFFLNAFTISKSETWTKLHQLIYKHFNIKTNNIYHEDGLKTSVKKFLYLVD